jgi:PAS domain S-box-containing protein
MRLPIHDGSGINQFVEANADSRSDMRFDPNFAAQILTEMANERSLEQLLQKLRDRTMERSHFACVQIWLIKPGDRCATCPKRPECPDQSRCLHLVVAAGKSMLEWGKEFGRLDPETAREPLGIPPIGSVVVSDQPRTVPDLYQLPVSPLDPDWMREEGIRGYAINPIRYQGEALGAMVSATREPFMEELRPWGRVFADHLGAAMANVRAFEELGVAGQRLGQANQRLERELAERKAGEEKLRQSEQRYRRLVDTASEGIWELDEHYTTTYVNRRMAEMLGHEPQEMVGRRLGEFLFEDDVASLPGRIAARRQELTERYEQRYRHQDGSAVWMYVSATSVQDADHHFMGSFAMLMDITERKLAEEALRRTAGYLAETQRLTHTGTFVNDGTIKPLFWSEEHFRIFGFDPRQGVPTRDQVLQRIHPDDVGKVMQAFDRVIHGKVDSDVECRVVLPDGTVKHIYGQGHPVLNANGELVEIVGTTVDITERKRAEDELRKHREHLEDLVKQRTEELAEAKARAEAANRAKSTFLANMSHELRTPLNAVLGFSRLLKNDPEVTPRQQETLDIIARSGEHLLILINNVLDMAKIESGRVVLEESEVDLPRLLSEIQSLMGVGAVEKGLRFALEHDPDLPRFVAVDAGKLRQVLLNLVGNGIKYTHSGGVKLQARLTRQAEAETARVRFEVADSGPGISPEDCQRIFFPFVQLGAQAPAETGTGLGLAICKQYVELMGGQIGVTSEPGKGSVFHFNIPVKVLPSVAEPEEPKHGRILGLAGGQPCCRLLIVEDQPENRLLLRRLLDPLGFEVREAANGQQAVALFEQWHPDLIWMDIRMPIMDGMEAVRRIRATPAGAVTKIIALTAHALEEERRPIMAAGCDDLVRKPFREQEIIDALARHLRLKFIYEKGPPQESTPGAPGPALRPEQLAELPAELLQDLRQAVLELDTARTLALLGQVTGRNASLGRALNTLATQLDYAGLLKILSQEHAQTGPTL